MKIRKLLITALLLIAFMPFSSAVAKIKKQDWDKREHQFVSRINFSSFNIQYRGLVSVADNDKEIAGISNNGFLKIRKSSFGNDRAIVIESNSNGMLSQKYFEGGKERKYVPDGKTWLADILYDVIRISGIGGKERILRIYKEDGILGALKEIEKVSKRDIKIGIDIKVGGFSKSADYDYINVHNMYMKALVDNIEFDDFELNNYMDALQNIVSNSTKGTILRTILKKYEFDRATMEQFLETTATLSYNTERGNTLRAFMKKYKINTSNYRDFFEIINGMSINSEKGNVLKPLLQNQEIDRVVFSALLRSADQFSHDAEKAAVLRKCIPHARKLNMNDELIRVAKTMDGGYYLLRDEILNTIENYPNEPEDINEVDILSMLKKARQTTANTRKTPVLRKIIPLINNNVLIMDTYFSVLRSMDNKMCKYNALLDLINNNELSNEDWFNVFDEVEDIAKSEYYHGAAAVLRDAFYKMPHETDLIEAYFDALDDIENDHNSSKEELIRMFCEEGSPDNETIAYLLKTIQTISVDIEKATSLIQVSKVMPKNNKQLEILFENIAEDIKSDYEYERIINAL